MAGFSFLLNFAVSKGRYLGLDIDLIGLVR